MAQPHQIRKNLRGLTPEDGRVESSKTEFLDSGQLAAAQTLHRNLFDVLVLPYRASFPVSAAQNFRTFLRAGGKFFSTGG